MDAFITFLKKPFRFCPATFLTLAAVYSKRLCNGRVFVSLSVPSIDSGRVQIAAATVSSNSFRQTVHTHHVSAHQAAKLVAALLRVAGVTAGLAESNGSLPPGL